MGKISDKKILIIDDDSFIRKIYKERLTADGFLVDEAEDGSEGLEKIKKGNYDLVLLDMVLPDMSGPEILKKIRSQKKFINLQIIILSALGQEADIKKAMDAGANKYIIKDKTTPQELTAILETLMKT